MSEPFISTDANALAAALAWLEGTLLGTLATTIAIITVAFIGFLMLAGRIDVRRAAHVIFGCFILFGASTIAAGIQGAISGTGAAASLAQAPPLLPPPQLPPPVSYQPASSSPFDPYAGAAIQQH